MREAWKQRHRLELLGWTAYGPRLGGWPPCPRCTGELEDHGARFLILVCRGCCHTFTKRLLVHPAALSLRVNSAYAALGVAIEPLGD